MPLDTFPLAHGWQLKQRNVARTLTDDFASSEGWTVATVPGSVHQDLLAANAIPDPFIGTNERDVQWVGEVDWLYRCRFDVAAALLAQPALALCFDGLDTFATVWLNGQPILTSDNMFIPQRIAVDEVLRAGENELQILFESALRRGKQREQEGGVRRLWNGDSSRLYVRKAQYHYGWDWGPTLLAAGPWRAIRLEAYSARIAEVHCPIEIAPDLNSATLLVRVAIEGNAVLAEIALFDPDGVPITSATVPLDNGSATHTFTLDGLRLWWPNGYGAQPLYRLVVTLRAADGATLDRHEQRLGLRRLRLIEEPIGGEDGSSFYFEVNNTPIFAGGANWIPADSFTPRITPAHYHALLAGMVAANMVMVRVWAGGIYEEAAFYEACDELGLLVWQDFMFACGMYPAMPWFQQSVRAEAEAQVRRLRHHASIALWCGNNEDYSIAHSLGVYDPQAAPDANSAFGARVIYEQVLAETCAALDGTRPYRPGSPFGGDYPDEPTLGDRHTWEVWHRDMAAYQDYPAYQGRFVSEFGMAAFPDLATVQAAAPGETDWRSPLIQHHQKADQGDERINSYLARNLGVPAKLDDYIFMTQLNQAEAMSAAYSGWRRRWGHAGKRAVGGALVWQWDDCWPSLSWALVDYNLRPKAAVYAVRRALAPLAVGIARSGQQASVWIASSHLRPVEAQLQVVVFSLDGEQISDTRQTLVIAPNAITEIGSFGTPLDDDQVLGARLIVGGIVGGVVLARAAAWPEPLQDALFAEPQITIEQLDGDRLRVSAARPAKGVLLAAVGATDWSDNLLDLLPDDAQIVHAPGLGGAEVTVRTFND